MKSVLAVFDCLELNGKTILNSRLYERRGAAEQLLADQRGSLMLARRISENGREAFKLAREKGWEGIIAKDDSSSYEPGQRSRSWLKVKCRKESEFVIGGYTAPEGHRLHFGALLVGLYDGKKLRFTGKVGTGYSEDVLGDLAHKMGRLRMTQSPFQPAPQIKGVTWVRPNLVAQVAFAEWTKDGKLRQPGFLGLRSDKEPSECQWGNVNNNRSSRAQEVRAVGTPRVVNTLITHPDKLWWSEEGITKLETAQYYAEVAPRLLPWLNNRLLTVERCPEGIEGGCYFEKNFAKGLPEDVPTLAVPAESSGKTVHYVVGGSKQTLLALVNLGCIAVHVMNCEVGSLDLPDWLAFDLDPSSGLFADAAKAAFLLRELLERMRIRSFPKTTGGRGLHVLVPLRPGPDQEQVRLFAHAICQELARMSPRTITVEARKANRQNRVFADWLRNAFGQTIAAPYSVRCRRGAPVSTPLDWEEVRPELNPLQFNLRTTGRRLAAKDPWTDFWRHRQDLPENMSLLPGGGGEQSTSSLKNRKNKQNE